MCFEDLMWNRIISCVFSPVNCVEELGSLASGPKLVFDEWGWLNFFKLFFIPEILLQLKLLEKDMTVHGCVSVCCLCVCVCVCMCVCIRPALTQQLRNADLASAIRMSWSVIPSLFNNQIRVFWASLYQRNQAPAFFSWLATVDLAPWQFIFLLAEPCELWLGVEQQVGGGTAWPDKRTDPAQHSDSLHWLADDT